METTEHLLYLSRQAEEKADELSQLIDRIRDLPIRGGRSCVFTELIDSGHAGDLNYGHGTAWSACNRIIDQRDQMARLVATLRAEAEVLTSIADDVIGKTGRLV